MRYSLGELAQKLDLQLLASDDSVTISGIASLESAGPSDLVFVEHSSLLEQALASRAGAIIAADFASASPVAKPLLIAKHPRLAFSRAGALLSEPPDHSLGVHPTAIVHPNARLGLGVSVGAQAVIGDSVTIGPRTRIGAHVCIASHVSIGSACTLAPHVSIYSHTAIGDHVMIHAGAVLGSDGFGFVRNDATGRYEKFPQVGRLEIGNDVEIGANCTIDRGALDATMIGSGVKLDNLVHIGHNVRIGTDVVIAAQTGISGSSVIGDKCIIGGQVGIADHVTIESGVILGAQCGVPSGKVIRGAGVVYWGTPARPIRQHLKELAILARMAREKEQT
jgi:UDP-3-O-[3-hydroxymyristoyl] glucosamine N-acyltransferase